MFSSSFSFIFSLTKMKPLFFLQFLLGFQSAWFWANTWGIGGSINLKLVWQRIVLHFAYGRRSNVPVCLSNTQVGVYQKQFFLRENSAGQDSNQILPDTNIGGCKLLTPFGKVTVRKSVKGDDLLKAKCPSGISSHWNVHKID